MQRITRGRLVLSLALVGALALAGCGGDNAYNISAEDQARIDMLTDDLAAAKTQAEADLKAAQDEIGSLTAQIGMEATDDMAATGLHKQLSDAWAAADMAQTTIGMMPGDDGMGGSGLQGDLAMYKATAADLEMQIGMMDDPATEADESSGLKGQLAMYQAKAADLQAALGMMADGDMAATGLYKQLADAMADAQMYKDMIGMMDDEADADGSLYAQLAAKQDMMDNLQSELDDVKRQLAGVEETVETGDMMTASAAWPRPCTRCSMAAVLRLALPILPMELILVTSLAVTQILPPTI